MAEGWLFSIEGGKFPAFVQDFESYVVPNQVSLATRRFLFLSCKRA